MLPASYTLPAASILLAGGLVACFAGQRFFRVVLAVFGFVLGALLATSFLAPTESPITLVTALGGGVAGALVLVLAYYVGVAFAGAALAAILVHLAWSRIGGEPHAIAIVGACIAGALITLALQRLVIIVGTAFGGAWTALVGVLMLMGRQGAEGAATTGDVWMAYPLNPAPGEPWVILAWLVLGAVGTIVQLSWTGGPRRGAKMRMRKKAA